MNMGMFTIIVETCKRLTSRAQRTPRLRRNIPFGSSSSLSPEAASEWCRRLGLKTEAAEWAVAAEHRSQRIPGCRSSAPLAAGSLASRQALEQRSRLPHRRPWVRIQKATRNCLQPRRPAATRRSFPRRPRAASCRRRRWACYPKARRSERPLRRQGLPRCRRSMVASGAC